VAAEVAPLDRGSAGEDVDRSHAREHAEHGEAATACHCHALADVFQASPVHVSSQRTWSPKKSTQSAIGSVVI